MRGSFGLPVTCYENLNLGSAVSLFFMLSGFVLAYAHERLDGWAGVMQFYNKRCFRIWPIHLAMLAGVILFGSFLKGSFSWIPPELPELAANVFLVQAWIPVPQYYFSFNAVSWSISAEWFFYIVFPIFLFAMASRRRILSSLTAALGLLVLMQCIAAGVPAYSGMTSGINQHGLVYISPLSRLFEFVAGMALYIGLHSTGREVNARVMSWLQISSLLLAVLYVMKSSMLAELCSGGLSVWVRSSSGVFVWALLIWSLSYQGTWISRALSHPLPVLLGQLSFALYMVHYPLGRQIAVYFLQEMNWTRTPVQVAVYFGIVSGLTCLLYFMVEKPGMALGRRVGRYFG